MNKIHKALSLLVLTLGVAGCGESFVNLTPPNVVAVDKFYQTQSDLQSALTGLYGTLRSRYDFFWVYSEVPSDNTTNFAESEVATGEFDKLTYRPVTDRVTDAWNGHYQTIANANILIEKAPSVTMDAALKTRYIAEAKFIRALMYFNLVRLFGDVPLITAQVRSEADAYNYPRVPVAQVYEQIQRDLTDAEAGLPASYPARTDLGRVTSGAAKALLGKVLLQQKKYAEAAAKLREVVTSGTYRLLPAYADVFKVGNDNNAEIVFAVQYTRSNTGEGSNFAIYFAPNPSGTTVITGQVPNSYNIGTEDLWNAYEPGDTRKAVSLAEFRVGAQVYYYSRKWTENPPAYGEGDLDWPVIRYADVLLMLAEAQNEQNQTADALTNLNLVRTRAGLPARTALNQADTRLTIEQERRVELAFEGHRWFDLIRAGKVVSTMQAFKTKYSVTTMIVGPERALLPIPFREISLNPELTQNPGY